MAETLAQVVGQHIREAREARGWKQDELGQQLGAYIRPWPKQVVSKVEHGDREVSASELMALALVLQTSISLLLDPDEGGLELTAGREVPAEDVVTVLGPEVTRRLIEEFKKQIASSIGMAEKLGIALERSAAVGEELPQAGSELLKLLAEQRGTSQQKQKQPRQPQAKKKGA